LERAVLDLHFITPGLAVGSRFPMAAAPRLASEHGITRVVDVRVEACDDEEVLRRCGIRFLHLPTEDTRAVSQPRIRDGVAFVEEGLARGERVLVHCQHGIGRSALVALCALVSTGEAPLDAVRRAKGARAVVSPSPEQLEAFLVYCRGVATERRPSWVVPTLEEVGSVVWSHLRSYPTGTLPRI
jgi:predicted protein tyrosine phosphatase